MRYIDYFELTKEFHGVKPFKCEFVDGLNVIVGENGSGKSTMLWLMSNPDFVKKEKLAKVKLVDDTKVVSFKFLDTEKQNPRLKSLNDLPKEFFEFGVASRFRSHGQVIFPLVRTVEKMTEQISFVDEPEAGVSLSNQVKFVEAFNKAVKNKCQVIIATHSAIIIESVKVVFDVEKRKWILSEDYLNRVLKK